PAADFAVRLAARRLPRLEGQQEPLPQRTVSARLERVEHPAGHLLARDRVGRDDDVPVDAMTGPRLVVGAGAGGGEAAHVQSTKLPSLDMLVTRSDLLEHARRRVPGTQEIQPEMHE